jgi:hypothetical protein
MKRIVFFCLILVGCASQKISKPFWEEILDSIQWDDTVTGYISGETNVLPEDMFRIMYNNGYKFVNSTHKADGEAEDQVYALERERASYDPSDDTFVFIGTFYPTEAPIWLIFSKDEDYALYLGPVDNEKEYRHIRISGKQLEE